MLPRLRYSLDFMPSPVKDRPGLMIRDPYQYSDATLIVPPGLVQALAFFDGEHSVLDLKEFLVRATGELNVSELQQGLEQTLSDAGFLENEAFEQRKQEAEEEFREAPVRLPVHAGGGYPDDPDELRVTFNEYLAPSVPEPQGRTRAIVAPHVSPFGGIDAYRAAYQGLRSDDAERTFVVLGTSHYGAPDTLGLTRKPFVTPYGQTRTDLALVDQIEDACGSSVQMEDYCHAIEHSIEFQVVFLQHLFGPQVKVVPVLCGPYTSVYQGGMPEDDEAVRRMLGGLGEIAARQDLLWVLGVDMAHMGQRYGDRIQARAGLDDMQVVEARDRARMEKMTQGNAREFWELVRENQDDLKWCGSAPIYTFLKAVPDARGSLGQYQQWNIDDASVVSFAGMRFT
jgi:AmmeMemoRadiSam system protein B